MSFAFGKELASTTAEATVFCRESSRIAFCAKPAPPLRSIRRATRSKNFDAFHRITADAGFATQHDRIRLLENGVGDIGDFGARRHRILDHRFQHVRRDDDRFAETQAALHDSPLNDRQFFHRALRCRDRRAPP